MPKVNTAAVMIDSHTDEKNPLVRYEFDVNVTKEGEFYTNLSINQVEFLIERGVRTNFNARTKKEGYNTDHTYDGLVQQVKSLFEKAYSLRLVSSEYVIRYALRVNGEYVLGWDNFSIYPNGNWVRKDEIPEEFKDERTSVFCSRWREGVSIGIGKNEGNSFFNHVTLWGISIYAKPIQKDTYEYHDGKRIVKEKPYEGESGSSVRWLHDLQGLSYEGSGLMEIECTEETASFFRNIFTNIARTNETLKERFEPKALMSYIQQSRGLLPDLMSQEGGEI